MKKTIILFIFIIVTYNGLSQVTIKAPDKAWGKSVQRTEQITSYENKVVYGTLDFGGVRTFYDNSHYIDIRDFHSQEEAKKALTFVRVQSRKGSGDYITYDNIFIAKGAGYSINILVGKYLIGIVAPTLREMQAGIESLEL